MSSFLESCPECGQEIEVEFTVTDGSGREEFWGAPVSLESAEVEFESDLKCPECGYRLDVDAAQAEALEAVA